MDGSHDGNDDSYINSGNSYVVEENDETIASGDGDEEKSDSPLREQISFQDRFLPIANVARIMKKSIPQSGKIAKDAKECVQECVSEFISFITSEASERCHQEKRKTINGEDILFAMSTLGFDNYVEPLKLYLQKYRESAKGEKTSTGVGSNEDMESLEQDMIGFIPAHNLSGATILSDQSGQQNVIYTSFPPGQLPQFG